MIQGIILSHGSGGSVVGPPGALLFLDFVHGVYELNGAAIAAADAIDKPEKIGAAGLEIRYDDEITPGTEIVAIIGAALTPLLTFDWTLVIEWEQLDNTFETQPFVMVRSDWSTHGNEGNCLRLRRTNSFNSFHMVAEDIVAAGGSRNLEDAVSHDVGTHRVAWTRTASRLAMSVDGATAIADETDEADAPDADVASFGQRTGDYLATELNVRSVTLYAAQADADLPALSAL